MGTCCSLKGIVKDTCLRISLDPLASHWFKVSACCFSGEFAIFRGSRHHERRSCVSWVTPNACYHFCSEFWDLFFFFLFELNGWFFVCILAQTWSKDNLQSGLSSSIVWGLGRKSLQPLIHLVDSRIEVFFFSKKEFLRYQFKCFFIFFLTSLFCLYYFFFLWAVCQFVL